MALWRNVFGYEADHNRPELAIDKKIATGDGLFFVAGNQHTVLGTVMAGYDGHRGWIYYVAVTAYSPFLEIPNCWRSWGKANSFQELLLPM